MIPYLVLLSIFGAIAVGIVHSIHNICDHCHVCEQRSKAMSKSYSKKEHEKEDMKEGKVKPKDKMKDVLKKAKK